MLSHEVKVHPGKIRFKVTRAAFMGHIIIPAVIESDYAHLATVARMPTPAVRKAVQRFMGIINYLNSFCPGLSATLHPL